MEGSYLPGSEASGEAMTPNNPLPRSGVDKVLGRGRGRAASKQVMRARVLIGQWPAAERGR
jgi:hypothetical protein